MLCGLRFFLKKVVLSFLKMPSPSKTVVKFQMLFFMSKAQAFHQSSFTFLQFSSDSLKHPISNVLKHTKFCSVDFITFCLLSRKYTYLQIKFLLLGWSSHKILLRGHFQMHLVLA